MSRPDVEEKRPPTLEERKAVTRLTNALLAVQHGDPIIQPRVRNQHGGVVNVPAVRRNERRMAMGQNPTEPMFFRRGVEHAPEVPISVGIALDISSSTRAEAEMVAVARWTLSHAITRANGQVAAALFGNEGWGIQRAGIKPPANIVKYAHNHGMEAFKDAFLLLDEELNLIDGDGARVLVVITDSHFVDSRHAQYAPLAMEQCRQGGVAVVWVYPHERASWRNWTPADLEERGTNFGYGRCVVAPAKPTEFADMIGEAIADEVRYQRSTL